MNLGMDSDHSMNLKMNFRDESKSNANESKFNTRATELIQELIVNFCDGSREWIRVQYALDRAQ